MSTFIRSYALLDIRIRSDGDGRTVEAYAAVWDTPTRIVDADGEYLEQIDRSAFNRTIEHRGDRPWPVLFNHGLTLHGTPSEVDTMPIGASVERPRVDGRGLVTVSRYHPGERADQALEAIRSGAITAQSFSGRFVRSDKQAPRRGWRAAADGTLELVTRTEIAMREYGPAVFAAYPDAAIVGVRSEDLLAYMASLATRLDPARADTPDESGPVAEDPPEGHSGRHRHQSLRRKAREKGAL